MPRPLGSRNPDYDQKKERLTQILTDHVLGTDLTRQSFRQFAVAAEVSEPTLRHYFGDREGVAAEILRALAERARPLWAAVAEPAESAAQAVDAYVVISKIGVAHGAFARAHAFGLLEGVADPRLGRAYLSEVLEPSLAALESRLRPYLPTDASAARAAALMLFAPMLLSVIHQDLLAGKQAAPMDLPALFDQFGALARAAIQPAEPAA